jgi:methionine-rich copper-binding protein CopC
MAGAALAVALAVQPAGAHAVVLESVPANDAVLDRAPDRVVLRFNSKIEKRLARISLTSPGAAPRALPVARDGERDRIEVPLGSLPPGRYAIRYKVLSADGHVTEGALRFSINPARQ